MPIDQHTLVRTLLRDRSKLFAYILSIVRDEHLAEDVFQDVSILALDKCSEIRDVQALPVWIRRAARFKALAALEKDARTPASFDNELLDLIDGEWPRFDALAPSDLNEALRQCLSELTPNNHQIIEMRYGQNLKSGQIAQSLGRTAHAVYIALARIHKQLAACIEHRLRQERADA
ncbi:MAG: sigma-70 family RNA polymerase sigma factor [Planctomycetes bacterium]|nr:sigma-70 family RNA polymerase sigma factor [Planctomycetota bacterium]